MPVGQSRRLNLGENGANGCKLEWGWRSDAVAALEEAMKRSPRIAKMLTAKKPRTPELRPGLTTLGGEDEAWYYRQSWRGVWERTGALDWLWQVTRVKT